MKRFQSLPLLITLALLNIGCGNNDPLSDHGKVFVTTEKSAAPALASSRSDGLLKVSQPATSNRNDVQEVEWEELIPPHWRADPNLIELYRKGEIDDDDPRVIETRQRLAEPMAPANPAFDGKRIKLAGFVVPLEVGKKKVTEFLLVPYHGACVHVPPPPTNQTILVKTGVEGAAIRGLFDTVWVVGTVKIEQIEGDVAISGYTLHAEQVQPYDQE